MKEKFNEPFELEFRRDKIVVKQYLIANQLIFRIEYTRNRPAKNLIRVKNEKGFWFWTFVPPSGEDEADEIGSLIAEYIKAKQ